MLDKFKQTAIYLSKIFPKIRFAIKLINPTKFDIMLSNSPEEHIMNTPNNARSILSKSKIKQAFVNLLETHNLSDITIGNICNRAGINRTTFYSHFSCLTDLYKSLEGELHEQLEKLYAHDPNMAHSNSILDIMMSILEVVKKYKNVHKQYMNKMLDISVVDRITDSLKKKYMPMILQGQNLTPEMEEHFFTFCKCGILGIISDWVRKDCVEACEQIARAIMYIVNQIRMRPMYAM